MSVTHKCDSKNTGVNLKHMSVNKMPDKHTHMFIKCCSLINVFLCSNNKYFNMLVVEHVC